MIDTDHPEFKMYESSVYVKCYYWLMDNYPEIHEEWEIACYKDEVGSE